MVSRLGSCVTATALTVTGVIGPAAAQSSSSDLRRTGYEMSIKCFIANGIVINDAKADGDRQKQQTYENNARVALSAAYQFGRDLGLSDQRIEADFSSWKSRELEPLMLDDERFRERYQNCRSLGLM